MTELTQSQKEIQKAAAAFAKGEFDKDLSQELEKAGDFPQAIWEKAGDLGFINAHYPLKYGGGEMGAFENCLIAETFCRQDSTIGCAVMLAGAFGDAVLLFADDDLKQKVLPGIAKGQALFANAFLEPDKSFDRQLPATTAVSSDDGRWIINGEKPFVINGGKSKFYLVLCTTDAAKKPPYGTGIFLVEADQDGVLTKGCPDRLGLSMSPCADVFFENVKVPASHVLGKKGHSLKQLVPVLSRFRLLMAAMALGAGQGAFDRALLHIKQREQFGKKIAQFKVTRQKIATMAIALESARSTVYGAAANQDGQKPDHKLCSMAFLCASKAAVEVSDQALQLLGGYGYMTESEVERFYRDAKTLSLSCGRVDAIQDEIAGSVIGKIR